VRELEQQLPGGFSVFEDPEFLEVTCVRCGYVMRYFYGLVDPEHVKGDCAAHRLHACDLDAQD